MLTEIIKKIEELKIKLPIIRDYLDINRKTQKITELTQKSEGEGFWSDSQNAGKIMQEIEELKKEILEVEEIENKLKNLEELAEISESKKDQAEIEKELEEISEIISRLEFKTLFDQEYDRNDAIINIMSGAGGVDAQDWSEMLLRMYLKWAQINNFKAKLMDETRGQEAGIKSATLEISGSFAYGYLKSEAGVHRLVRLSPFNADNLRQTSFALVEIMPVISEMKEVLINPQDLRIDVYRSSGAGGQSVNTTDSAVRITHIPTGVVSACQNERSQLQNKEQAMKILKAKLHKKYLEEVEEEKRKLRGESLSAEWGSQIRSYVIHPYKMVKDHRTKHETAQAESVLEGNLNEFMESYLKYLKK
ncbi:MAG: Peptide chain release factor 2 [Candidatus Moranbacteria bacterium GW2011_GWF2_36_839]|nr:MAG: Peptide chain release factor 2 [Candidatus Moranbacteria bacterium GW2011_GWF1_36_78]KKQ17031.1 MAG: Peptide chain release factor 2 [Candidatus Moranbacteria bacterium GW2011_GWF2_36_839]HAT74041.1 peptide chain release factor 2 [Candidatus Moranbacteria bacterium]HBY11205.1 peptide chain release factor 2 [Candidatus Moranbacteria bacterium]